MFVLILTLLVVVSAFFSISEIALTAARRTKLQVLSERGDHRATKVLLLKEEPGNFFTVVQIGVNSVAILAGILGEKHVSDLVYGFLSAYLDAGMAQRIANISSFLIVTLLFIQFADLIPKRIAMTFPEACAVQVIGPMLTLLKLFKPVVWVFNAAADATLKLFGIPTKPVDQITTEDIAAMVDAGAEAGVLHKHELHLIENVFELDSKPITAIMTQRDDVVFLTLDDTADGLRRKLVKQPHAQYPVCGKNIDDVLGYMESKVILQLLLADESGAALDSIGKHYDKNVLVIPDTLTLSESLTRFREMHENFAVVMNEYGLVVGIVTLDDIVGALMGDILYSNEDEQIVRRDESSWLVDGLTPLVDLKKALDIDALPGEDYVDTAAGLVIYSLKRIPKKSEAITVAGFRFEVVDIDHHKIDQLLVSRLPASASQPVAAGE
ncbi:magnesium and cobalt exporter, CNNM family [Cupriavidus metallidurans]|jgi:CBS domain containing-hemolysin-like protein|uniref:hemolysin family protein n=1 Tax=Cupriavidus metallidurans TaxID=119219 RepID=UPI0004934270|nr:hemolysin family protein [Cupriavidus metallidurans]AVA32833.1 HlyC/CorC family transporter [Cupriavidus metallidurans]MDE4917006.1 hemolysin family protein [Cupriavidus metallidurans]UBM11692.1 hemolysin family protein [Cupriavidus metallidurans]